MGIKAPEVKPSFQVEAGTYIARCYSMVHIGTNSFEWQGVTKKTNKVRITFELPTELHVFKEGEEAKPCVISKEYSLSLHEKSKLRPILEAWRGKKFTEEEIKDFDLTKLVGVPAFISVIHNEKGYAEIASISKIPKGMECPPQVNPSVTLDYENFNPEIFDKLPEFLKLKIKSSEEYKKMMGETVEEIVEPSAEEEVDANSIPF